MQYMHTAAIHAVHAHCRQYMHTICTTYSSVHAVCVQYMQCVCSTCNVCAVCMQYMYLCMQSLCRQCFSSSTLTLPPLFTHTTQHTLPRQELCPAGRYGSVEGLTDRGCSRTGVGNVALGDSGGTLELGGVGYVKLVVYMLVVLVVYLPVPTTLCTIQARITTLTVECYTNMYFV